MGLSNYGIKRMLPRLIIAAIAVNVSYYICQAMVDLSNILGYEIMHALQQLADQVGPSAVSNSSTSTSASGNGILNKIVIGILGAAALVWLLVGPTAAIILFILVTALTVVIILLLRKAFIILLVVASPFAFVAYLLPNTEQFFQKWLSMFWKLLMVFPVVALLMGGGQLASAIILAAGSTDCGTSCDTVAATTDSVNTACSSSATAALPTGNGNTATPSNNTCEATVNGYGTSGEGAVGIGNNRKVGWTLGLVATGIAVAPLLAVWSVLQGAISAAGAIGGKITSAVSKGVGNTVNGGYGGAKRTGGKLKDMYKGSDYAKFRARRKDEIDLETKTGNYKGVNPMRRGKQRYYSAMQRMAENGGDKKNGRTTYAGSVVKGLDKDENEYIRNKAQDAIAKGDYWDKAEKALASGNEQDFKIARMAIGSQEGRAGLELLDQLAAQNSTASGQAFNQARERHRRYGSNGGGQPAAGGAGGSQQPAPQPQYRYTSGGGTSGGATGGGGGTATGGGGQRTGAQGSGTARPVAPLAFRSFLDDGAVQKHDSGHILNQVEGRGGKWSDVRDADVINALKHTEAQINSGKATQDDLQLHYQATAEKQSRGLK